MASPLLSATTLNQRFAGTQGFSIAFRREGLSQMQRHFPEFTPYLERVMPSQGNAFFLNPLVICQGARVAPHIDRSLKSWTHPEIPPCPLKVSVLYVQVPEDMVGGQLILYRNKAVATIQPETNLLVEFLGTLRHEVGEVDGTRPRISLVCESYRMPEPLLECIPEFFVRTKRPFEEFLQEAVGPESEEPEDADPGEAEPLTEAEAAPDGD